MQPIRWGIIGCGDVTEKKSGPGFQKASGSALVAVMRRDGAKAADYARRHGVPKWYDDGQKLIHDPEVDAVYIATPPSSHEQYALRVCAAGKPCYVEKPIARNSAEGQRMVQAFAARGVPLFVAFYRRGLPPFVRAKEIIDSGELGTIRRVSYTYADCQMAGRLDPVPWRLEAEHSGGGLFFDLGSHALDLLDFFAGPLQDVTGRARNSRGCFDVEDQVSFSFAGGEASFDFTSDQPRDKFIIEGARGTLELACRTSEPLCVRMNGAAARIVDLPLPEHVQQPLIQAVVDSLGGGRHEWLSTGEVALRTQRVMDRVTESFYGGREDGFWRRKRP